MRRCQLPRDRQDAGHYGARAPVAAARGAARIDPLPDLHQGGRRRDGQPDRQPLAAWVRIQDKVLREDLFALRARPTPSRWSGRGTCSRKVLDCPGGLKIQTIHSFAQSLLAAFPAEAGIVPGFQPIEGRAEQELVRRTLAELMARRGSERRRGADPRRAVPEPPPGRGRRGGVSPVLRAQGRRAEGIRRGPCDRAAIRRLMNLPDGSPEDYIAEHCGDDRLDCDLLRRSPMRTANGALPPALARRDDRGMARADADRAGARS